MRWLFKLLWVLVSTLFLAFSIVVFPLAFVVAIIGFIVFEEDFRRDFNNPWAMFIVTLFFFCGYLYSGLVEVSDG